MRSGVLKVDAGSFPSGASPNEFGVTISFQDPYPYDGGNLLLEIRHNGNGTGIVDGADLGLLLTNWTEPR